MPPAYQQHEGEEERAGGKAPARGGKGVQHVVNPDDEAATRGSRMSAECVLARLQAAEALTRRGPATGSLRLGRQCARRSHRLDPLLHEGNQGDEARAHGRDDQGPTRTARPWSQVSVPGTRAAWVRGHTKGKSSNTKGQAVFVMILRSKAFGKRLVTLTTAKTPKAKASKRSSVRLPRLAHAHE